MSKECFVIMPFSDKANPADNKWDDLFDSCIKPAVEGAELGYACVRSLNPHGNFMRDIAEHLVSAEVVIGILTELRPNVMYELGIRHALKRKTIMLAERDSDIPSDLNAYIALRYSTDTMRSRKELTKSIRERLLRLEAGELKSDNPVSDYLSDRAERISEDWYKNQDPQAFLPRLAEILPSYAFKLGPILNKVSQYIQQKREPAVDQTSETYAPIPLDRRSLSMYIGSSSRVKQLDKRMAEASDVPLEKWDSSYDALLDRYLEKAQYLGITTVAELDEAVKNLGQLALRLSYYFRVDGEMHAGYCLEHVFNVKIAQSGTMEDVIKMYESLKLESAGRMWAEEVWHAYEQVRVYAASPAATTQERGEPKLTLVARRERADRIILGIRNTGDGIAKSPYVEVVPPYGYMIAEGGLDGEETLPRLTGETESREVRFGGASNFVIAPDSILEFAVLTWESVSEALNRRPYIRVWYKISAEGTRAIEDNLMIDL